MLMKRENKTRSWSNKTRNIQMYDVLMGGVFSIPPPSPLVVIFCFFLFLFPFFDQSTSKFRPDRNVSKEKKKGTDRKRN